MCGTCGCGAPGTDAHAPASGAGSGAARRIEVERSLLADNAHRAEHLRADLGARGIAAIGLLGGPGAGKTALLEASFAALGPRAGTTEAVVEGDCATDRDARRIAACGVRAAQVATGALCHLDASLVQAALGDLDLSGVRRLWIENVGNLVCPAPFPCGETRRALLISVTEGDDKPEKYPAAVAAADLLVVTKIDLLPHVDFELERCRAAARAVHPDLPILALSARTGAGLPAWLEWAAGGD
ncbi:MAG: hydrogenase nickel incorporation protein HypB [Myxococcota bacterium]|nr:hydrogenase nickel incorporation protein HypB [Myxococcota bacterium]